MNAEAGHVVEQEVVAPIMENVQSMPGQATLVKENSETENDDSNVRSYGIEIKRHRIKSVPLAEQDLALKDLGVSAYEQETFEEGVLQQVDEQIEKQKIKITKEALHKDLLNIRLECKETQEQIEKVEKSISAIIGNALEDFNARRGYESLKSHRDLKVKQLKKLKAREKSTLKNISELELQPETIAGSTTIAITEDQRSVHNDDKGHSSKPYEQRNENFELLDKYDRVKSRKRKLKIQDEFSDHYSSDEEFIPYPDEVSDELTDDEFETASANHSSGKKLKLFSTKKGEGRCHKQLKSTLKGSRLTKPKKVADDGDVKVYNERIRILRLKKRMNKNQHIDGVSDSESMQKEAHNCKKISLSNGFSLPVKFWKKLYKYQRTGVKWLWQLHCQDVGGIVGDEMGLGKTIQIIAFLTGLRNSHTGKAGLGATLIACPATMLHQWVKEFHKWSPEFRVAILHETGSYTGRKSALIRHIVNDKGVMVTSYSNLRIHQDELLRYVWDYIILDEGHRIRNPDAEITLACKQFQTAHRLILSGSPLQNNLKELWSLFDFIFPGKLGTLPVFMTEFSVPITLGGYSNATSVQVQTAYKCASILRDTISPYLLRRMKKDVNQTLQLPSRNEQVLFCQLTDEQSDLYKKYINSRDVSSILAGKMKVFPGLIMLRKICNHPDLSSAAGSLDWMKEKQRGKEETADPIQYEHGYGHWLRSGKMIVVESLLKLWRQQGHRVLLFSQTRQMLDIMESFVKMNGYIYLRMDGSTSVGSRQPIVDAFNQDKSIFVFLLTTRVGGIGLNLIGADRIIIFDPDWNPSTDTQARERSWRIGQDKHVTIYRLLTTGTIEEKIYHRQIFKQFLTNRVLKNPAQRRFFKSNDLHELFTLGDTKPNQSTETNAIFAGTGSEVNLHRKFSTSVKPNATTSAAKASQQSNPLKKSSKPDELEVKKSSSSSSPIESNKNARHVRDVWKVNEADLISRGETYGSSTATNHERKEEVETSAKVPNIHSLKVQEDEKNPTDCDVSITDDRKTAETNLMNDSEEDASVNGDCSRDNAMKKMNKSTETSSGANCKAVRLFKHKSNELKRKSVKKSRDVKRKRRKIKYANIDGAEINYLLKTTIYDESKKERSKSDELIEKEDDEEILLSLFKNTGVHSALKHDRIVESENPDYILVEKEAERVAKQAVEALRESRAICQTASMGEPTWTGSRGSAGFHVTKGTSRFGAKQSTAHASNVGTSGDVKNSLFNGEEILGVDHAKESVSSTSLLKRMRARSALAGKVTSTDVDAGQYSVHGRNNDAGENILLRDIRDFIAFKAKNAGQATTQEILQEFKSRIATHENALFKELLKQVCDFQKINGVGIWYLKSMLR